MEDEIKNQVGFPYRFFVVTFLWSWLIWIPLALAGAGVFPLMNDLLIPLTIPITILGAFGPAVGAFYSLRTLHGKGAISNYLRSLLDFNFGWRAWLFPIVLFGGSTWLAWILPELWGESRVEMLLPSVWVFPPYLVLIILLGGGQEELGWRGYILDYMEERLGPGLGNLVLGMVWAVWHLPLFYVLGSSQYFTPFAGFVLLIIGYSYVYGWIRQLSGKRTLAGLVTHGWANAFVPLFPTLVMLEGVTQPRYWIWASLTFVMGLVVMIMRWRESK